MKIATEKYSSDDATISELQPIALNMLDEVSGGWEVSAHGCVATAGAVACGSITIRGGGDDSAYSATARRR